jgi:hypothetical protein
VDVDVALRLPRGPHPRGSGAFFLPEHATSGCPSGSLTICHREPAGHGLPLHRARQVHTSLAVTLRARDGDRCARHCIGDGEVVVADPTAAGLAIKQPGVVRDAEPGSQGRDPPVVGSHQDRSKG